MKMNIEFLEKTAKEIVGRGGQHVPMIFVKTKDKTLSVYGLKFRNTEEKEKMCNAFRKKVMKEKISQYFVVMEGWLSSNIHVMPSKDINRKEILIISEFNESMERKVIIIPFTRNGDDIVWHEKIELSDDNGEQYNAWDFYRENVMEEVFEKHRKEALLKDLEEADLKGLIKKVKEDYECETGKTAPPEFNEVHAKDIIKKLINDGKISKHVEEINETEFKNNSN